MLPEWPLCAAREGMGYVVLTAGDLYWQAGRRRTARDRVWGGEEQANLSSLHKLQPALVRPSRYRPRFILKGGTGRILITTRESRFFDCWNSSPDEPCPVRARLRVVLPSAREIRRGCTCRETAHTEMENRLYLRIPSRLIT